MTIFSCSICEPSDERLKSAKLSGPQTTMGRGPTGLDELAMAKH